LNFWRSAFRKYLFEKQWHFKLNFGLFLAINALKSQLYADALNLKFISLFHFFCWTLEYSLYVSIKFSLIARRSTKLFIFIFQNYEIFYPFLIHCTSKTYFEYCFQFFGKVTSYEKLIVYYVMLKKCRFTDGVVRGQTNFLEKLFEFLRENFQILPKTPRIT
jgi:hypothetical protein